MTPSVSVIVPRSGQARASEGSSSGSAFGVVTVPLQRLLPDRLAPLHCKRHDAWEAGYSEGLVPVGLLQRHGGTLQPAHKGNRVRVIGREVTGLYSRQEAAREGGCLLASWRTPAVVMAPSMAQAAREGRSAVPAPRPARARPQLGRRPVDLRRVGGLGLPRAAQVAAREVPRHLLHRRRRGEPGELLVHAQQLPPLLLDPP